MSSSVSGRGIEMLLKIFTWGLLCNLAYVVNEMSQPKLSVTGIGMG